LANRDAKNRWLARQNRVRLPAENIRDQFLAAGGLMDGTIGGPSAATSTHKRGLYVKFKRSTPEAMLTTFDAPAATVSCPARERSNTPLQALTLLNDPLYVDCARGLAKRMTGEGTDSVTGIQQAWNESAGDVSGCAGDEDEFVVHGRFR
jgi:hypothetical protein